MNIQITALSKLTGKSDLFFIGAFEGEDFEKQAAKIEPALASVLDDAKERKRFIGTFDTSVEVYGQSAKASEVIVLGLGQKKNYRGLCLRKTMAKIAQVAAARKSKKIRVALESFSGGSVKAEDVAAAAAGMPCLALYKFDAYVQKKKDVKGWRDGLPQTISISTSYISANFASDLINFPNSGWSNSIIGFTAPAYTPLFWLMGIGLIGNSFYFNLPYRPWYYISTSILFLIFHNFHAFTIYSRTQ
jgi:leucyl aminopeptidase